MTPQLHTCTNSPHIKRTTKEDLGQNFDTKFIEGFHSTLVFKARKYYGSRTNMQYYEHCKSSEVIKELGL